jgi:UDPglucose--hexose-1-phosphate uridylyltransferase
MNGAPARGHQEVLIPRAHDWARFLQTPVGLRDVLRLVKRRMTAHRRDGSVCVITFANIGAEAGASLRHPHFQLYALPLVPPALAAELRVARRYAVRRPGRCIYCDEVAKVCGDGARLVLDADGWVCFTRDAPRFPFELVFVGRRHEPDLSRLSPHETARLADTLRRVVVKLRQRLGDPPMNLVFHGAPLTGRHGAFHCHVEIVPRLQKPGGFEIASGLFINGVSPEAAAQRLTLRPPRHRHRRPAA